MKEQITPYTGDAPETKKPFPVFLLAALLAAGLCLALIFMGHGPRSAATAPAAGAAGAGKPAAQALPAAPPVPAAAPIPPLGRSLEDITTKHTTAIKPYSTEPILSGPLEGGVINKYHTGSGTDDLYIFNGAAYRRVMSFRLAEMLEQVEGTHAHFSGLVFIYGLYPSAFDEDFKAGQIPPEVQKLADAYGDACGALAEPGSRPQEHREQHKGYVFSCSNRDTTRLIYGVCSEGLQTAEAAGGK